MTTEGFLMRLHLPEATRDPHTFHSIFDRGMAEFPQRYSNYLEVEKNLREPHIITMPVMMDVEPVSRCNYRCGMCVVSLWKGQKRAQDMTLDLFQCILEQQYGLWEIKLQGLGEPLLNPHLPEMIALCAEKKIWTRTALNGSLLHVNSNAERILEAGIGEVQISLDGASKEVYEGIRTGGDFELFTRNCRLLNLLAAPLRSIAATRAAVLVQQKNIHELEEIVEFCAHVGFQRTTFSLNLGYYGNETLKQSNKQRDVRHVLTQERALALIEQGKRLGIEVTFWQGGNKFDAQDPQKLCYWLWKRAYISSEGRIVPCCYICDPSTTDMGWVKEFPLHWRGERYQRMRYAHLQGKIPPVCQACYSYGENI